MNFDSFEDMINSRRVALGLTLEQVGDAVGVGKSTVRKWEKGLIKNMGRDKLAALARVLELPPAALIERDTSDEAVEDLSEDLQTLLRLAKHAKPEAVRAAAAVLKAMEGSNHDL